MVEPDLTVCITSLESGPLLFVGILATIHFTVLCVIGLSLRIIVTCPIYYLEGREERTGLSCNVILAISRLLFRQLQTGIEREQTFFISQLNIKPTSASFKVHPFL